MFTLTGFEFGCAWSSAFTMRLRDFQTTRLIATHWSTDLQKPDCKSRIEEALRGILAEDVLRALPPALHQRDTPISDWMSERDAESDVYLVCTKEDEDLIGLLIVALVSNECVRKTAHIGYLFGEPYWGQGYATEVVHGLGTSAQALAPITLRAGVDATNSKSGSVLQKSGLTDAKPASGDAPTQYLNERSERPCPRQHTT